MTVKECIDQLMSSNPFMKGCRNIDKFNDYINSLLEILEKQIPKVPTYSGDGYYNGEMVIDTWECPCCGKQYEVDYDDYKYCPNCGQHIDHSTLTEDD